ncbi:MAG: hypothetical protein K0R57_1137 [Paenibacillaceae bacterium]|jgi:ribulose 1,5-bisphosphate synthetase/thiazole synthase|nr:hypothetical protein [Paenibacillaceae bacterium]
MKLLQKVDALVVEKGVAEIPFSESYDVIVAGLGTAGAIAAIAAARRGLKVLGIEKMNGMGGTGTAGAVNGYYFGSPGGFFEELDEVIEEYHGKVYTKFSGFNPDAKKYALERAALEHGVQLCYESTVIGVFMEGNCVKGIQWIGPRGLNASGCQVVIDCTGDAEVSHLAGCKTHMGRELDGRSQPFTSVKVCLKGGNMVRTNLDSGCTDQTNAFHLSDGIVNAHARQLEDAYPEEDRLFYLAPLIGIREGRRIEGKVTLTLSDELQGQHTEEPVFYASADVDKHGRDNAMESEVLQDWLVASNLGAVNICVPVPLGVMIPKEREGILVAGRCMSFDHDLSSCVRMQRDMQKAGEAAAETAWLSIRRSISIHDVSYEELRPILEQSGCLDEKNNTGAIFAYPANPGRNKSIEWLTDREQIREGLSGERPGVAIWSSKRLGGTIIPYLREWMEAAEAEFLKKHSAIALAVLGDPSSLPVLRDMVKQRDSFVLQDCRKHNQMRGYMAIYLLGKLRDKEIIPELCHIIENPEELHKPLYEMNAGSSIDAAVFRITYFQYFIHSVMSLIKLGNSYEESRDVIGKSLNRAVEDGSYIQRITSRESGTYEYSVTENIKNVVKAALEGWREAKSR